MLPRVVTVIFGVVLSMGMVSVVFPQIPAGLNAWYVQSLGGCDYMGDDWDEPVRRIAPENPDRPGRAGAADWDGAAISLVEYRSECVAEAPLRAGVRYFAASGHEFTHLYGDDLPKGSPIAGYDWLEPDGLSGGHVWFVVALALALTVGVLWGMVLGVLFYAQSIIGSGFDLGRSRLTAQVVVVAVVAGLLLAFNYLTMPPLQMMGVVDGSRFVVFDDGIGGYGETLARFWLVVAVCAAVNVVMAVWWSRRQLFPSDGQVMVVDDETAPVSAVGSVVGYRTWRVRDGRLLSLTNNVRWPLGGALEAENKILFNLMITLLRALPEVARITLLASAMAGMSFLAGRFMALTDAARALFGIFDLPFVIGAATALPLAVVARVLYDNRHLFTRRFVSLLSGPQVFARERTPGIYALYVPRDPDPDRYAALSGRKSMLVLGTVSLWGKTIEYTHGVKGQFAHPEALTHVACMKCWQWMPIADYKDPALPPSHVGCRVDDKIVKGWKDKKLWAIREACPGWFRTDADRAAEQALAARDQ